MKVLITGVDGYIGRNLKKRLEILGFKVWGISRKKEGRNIFKVDLLDLSKLLTITKKIDRFSFLIHCAADAHKYTKYSKNNNIQITKNIISAFSLNISHIIFLSSVAVYGEDKRFTPININDRLRPSSEYGQSKVICETLLKGSDFKNYSILRLAPVYDKNNLNDVKKRVYFPGLNFKISIKPSPKYNFVSIENVNEAIITVIKNNFIGKNIINIADKKIYYQNDLIYWFKGKHLIFPALLVRPIYLISYIFPNSFGYKLRCNIHKLFYINLYKTQK